MDCNKKSVSEIKELCIQNVVFRVLVLRKSLRANGAIEELLRIVFEDLSSKIK